MGNFSPSIPILVLFLLFFNFLDVKIDPHRLFRKELLITLSLSFVIMPVITYHGLSIGFNSAYRTGLLLTACAPSGIMGIILIRFMKLKDYNLAFSNFFFTTFGSILLIPIILKLLIGQTVAIDIRPLIGQTAVLIIAPFTATRLVNRFCHEKGLFWIKKCSTALTPVLVFLIISTSIASASDELKWDLTLLRLSISVLAIYLLQGGLGFWIGNLIGGKELRNTLTFISSSRNLQIVLAVVILNFSPLATVPIIIATIFHNIMNAFWLWALQKN